MCAGHRTKAAIFTIGLSTLFCNLINVVSAAPEVPVIIGGSTNEDACGAMGAVAGFKSNSSVLAVRSGPGTSFAQTDSLPVETVVFVCDFQGDWIGIVYGKDLSTCAVSSPLPTKLAYHGPCLSGWVHKQYLRIVAG
jgi:hypothetical protein